MRIGTHSPPPDTVCCGWSERTARGDRARSPRAKNSSPRGRRGSARQLMSYIPLCLRCCGWLAGIQQPSTTAPQMGASSESPRLIFLLFAHDVQVHAKPERKTMSMTMKTTKTMAPPPATPALRGPGACAPTPCPPFIAGTTDGPSRSPSLPSAPLATRCCHCQVLGGDTRRPGAGRREIGHVPPPWARVAKEKAPLAPRGRRRPAIPAMACAQ